MGVGVGVGVGVGGCECVGVGVCGLVRLGKNPAASTHDSLYSLALYNSMCLLRGCTNFAHLCRIDFQLCLYKPLYSIVRASCTTLC